MNASPMLPDGPGDGILSAALWYAALGWSCFPVEGKRPFREVRSWSEESTTDPATLSAWFAGRSGLGIGVDCAKSDLVAVDGDHLGELDIDRLLMRGAWILRGNPERLTWLFRRGGRHVPQARHAWGDVKSGGGYIVLPPSPHPAGWVYEWVERPGDRPAEVPDEVVRAVAPKEPVVVSRVYEGGAASDAQVEFAMRILSDRRAEVAEATEGGRNSTLNAAAFVLGHYVPHYLSERAVTDGLLDAAAASGLVRDDGARSVRGTILSGLRAGMRDPRALADLTVPTLDVGSTLPEDLWTATPLLAQVRTAAHAVQVGAAGLLGALLARVSMQTHHTVELPATPNRGSLNLFVGLAAPSGMGKGSCVQVASRLLPGVETPCGCGEHEEGDHVTLPTGTGEGLTRAFWESVRSGQARQWRRDRWHVLVDVDEIEALLALSGRQGATIGPVLRSLWSGSKAGFQNASADRRFPLDPGSYRIALVAGVQPAVVARLFDEAMGGTPQRFLWLPALGGDIPDLSNGGVLPEWPGELPPVQAEALGEPWRPFRVAVSAEVAREVTLRRNAVLRGSLALPALDSHRDFLRLRVAALLAIMHGHREVSEEFWWLGGIVMNLSDATRSGMLAAASAQREAVDEARGRSRARVDMAAESAHVERLEKVAATMGRAVRRHGEEGHHPCTARCALNAVGGRYAGEVKRAALDLALERDWIVREEDGVHIGPGSAPVPSPYGHLEEGRPVGP